MCAVSATGDMYKDKFTAPDNPWLVPSYPQPIQTPNSPYGTQVFELNPVRRQEFDELKTIVLEMKQLLLEAKAKDEAEGVPDCEMEDKVAILKQVAKLVGVSLEDVFGK